MKKIESAYAVRRSHVRTTATHYRMPRSVDIYIGYDLRRLCAEEPDVTYLVFSVGHPISRALFEWLNLRLQQYFETLDWDFDDEIPRITVDACALIYRFELHVETLRKARSTLKKIFDSLLDTAEGPISRHIAAKVFYLFDSVTDYLECMDGPHHT